MNELLEKQLKAKPSKRMRPVKQSVATGTAYAVELRKLVRQVRKDINEFLTPVLKRSQFQYQADATIVTTDAYLDEIVRVIRFLQTKWSSAAFLGIAERVASNFVTTADRINRDRFDKTVKTFGINVFQGDTSLNEYLTASVYDNTQLIKSIPTRYLDQVESIVMTNVRAGNRSSAIVSQLSKQFGVTERRAKMIARDQTAKINGDLVEKRQRAVGFEYFQWLDSDDERVRDRHSDIADKITAYGKGIYRWDNLPLSVNGVPIKPGQDYQCRCVARPVSNEEVEANQKAGRVNPSVKR